MKNLSMAPCIWNDVLLSFGFFITKEEIDLSNFYVELKKYSNNQPLFTSNEVLLSRFGDSLGSTHYILIVAVVRHFIHSLAKHV